MRRLLHLLIMSFMITGLLFFGATSAFASDPTGLTDQELLDLLQQQGDDGGGLLGEEGGVVQELLCALLGEGLLGEDDLDGLGIDGGGLLNLDCDDDVVVPPGTTPPVDPAPNFPTGGTGADFGGQVSHVPSGGVSTGGGTAPVGATALMGTLLAIAAVGAGVGRALARS